MSFQTKSSGRGLSTVWYDVRETCFFLVGYFIYLHFKMLSPFPISPSQTSYPTHYPLLLWGCSPSHPPTLTTPPCHSPTLGHRAFRGPRASPPIDDRQGHPLIHMQLEPWVTPCVLFGWWFSPWELWEFLLVDIVLPMGLQYFSAPSVLSQLFPWSPCAQYNGWLRDSTSILVRLWPSLSGHSDIRLLSVSTSWHQP